MPDIRLSDINMKAVSPKTREKYISMVKYQQRKYYWLLLISGCGLFLFGAVI